MDLMNAAKYMSSVWVAKAPATMHSQPSQPVTPPPSVSQTDSARQVNSTNKVDAFNRVDAPELTSPQDKTQQQEKEQQLAFEQVIAQLRARDQEVRTHEQAHLSAAGPYATGGIQYDYQTGPDGHKYAVGGSVGIDTSPVSGDPEATIQKMRVVHQAALAPAQPSAQDFKVAAQASQLQAQARSELQAERAEESEIAPLSSEEKIETSENRASASLHSIRAINQSDSGPVLSSGIFERNTFDLRLRLQDSAA